MNKKHYDIENIKSNLNYKPLIFTGFMASGKTTIARIVSKILNYKFIDTDKEIEKNINTTIYNFFNKYGEKNFREIEEKIILELINQQVTPNIVISLGGGSFMNKKIVRIQHLHMMILIKKYLYL